MDEAMSGITQAQAQSILDSLIAARASANDFGSVTIAGRTITYRNTEDLTKEINYWSRIVSGYQRQADGHSRHGFKVANFQNTQ